MTVAAMPLAEPPAWPAVFGFPLEGVSDAALAEGLRALGRLGAQLDARRAEYLQEADRRGLAGREGYASTTAWLMALSGDPAAVCRSRLAVASSLGQMPETRAAFAAGEVSESRVRVLAQAQAVAPGQFRQDEERLVAQVVAAPSSRVPQVMAAWKRSADPQAAEVDADRLHEQRALHLSPAWSGMVRLSGDLDPEGGLTVLAALRSLAEPATLDPADSRTQAQCRADALVEICRRHLRGDGLGSRRPPRVLVTIPWGALSTGRGVVDTEAGAIPAESARRLCCDATISRVLVDPQSVPVELGRATRVVPPALRRLLEARDRGCTHPSCDLPARFCDAHHLRHWADGGTTEPANPSSG